MSLRDVALNRVTGGEYGRLRDLRESLPQIIHEAADWAIKRAQEDAKWQKFGVNGEPPISIVREKAIRWARWAFTNDAMIKRGVLTKTEFAFGDGIEGPSGQEVGNADIAILREFWEDPSNQSAMFSYAKQFERSNQLLVDGEMFLMLFVQGRRVQVRRMAPLSVVRIVTDPEDSGRPLYYATVFQRQALDVQTGIMQPVPEGQEVRYYADWRNGPEQAVSDPFREVVPAVAGVYLMHVAMNRIEESGFGVSDVLTSIPWSDAAKMVAEDQATISRSTAALMNRLVASGSQAELQALQTSLRSTTETGGPQPPLPGAMNIMDTGTQLEVSRASTNAGDAWQNSRLMRLPMAAGLGLSLHYLADPENANLATASSMELPQLKMLTAYQMLWVSVYRDLCDFVLQQHGRGAQDLEYDFPVPNLVNVDVAQQVAAILDVFEAGRMTGNQASRLIFGLLNVDDLPTAMAELQEQEEQADPGEEELQSRLASLEGAMMKQRMPGGEMPPEKELASRGDAGRGAGPR